MKRKTLKGAEEIIYAICILCRDHEQAELIEGIKVEITLAKEIYIS